MFLSDRAIVGKRRDIAYYQVAITLRICLTASHKFVESGEFMLIAPCSKVDELRLRFGMLMIPFDGQIEYLS